MFPCSSSHIVSHKKTHSGCICIPRSHNCTCHLLNFSKSTTPPSKCASIWYFRAQVRANSTFWENCTTEGRIQCSQKIAFSIFRMTAKIMLFFASKFVNKLSHIFFEFVKTSFLKYCFNCLRLIKWMINDFLTLPTYKDDGKRTIYSLNRTNAVNYQLTRKWPFFELLFIRLCRYLLLVRCH